MKKQLKTVAKKALNPFAAPIIGRMKKIAQDESQNKISSYAQYAETIKDQQNKINILEQELSDLESSTKYICYYHGGSGNHGCEALVRTIAQVCKIDCEKLGIYSYRPEEDREFGLLDVASFFKKSNLDATELPTRFRNGTVALSIGGDNYCGYPIPQLAKYNRLFHERGAKTALIGCSIEPDNLKHPEIVGDLCQFDLITARETITYNALLDKGIDSAKLKLIPDTAFLLPIEDSKIKLPENTIGLNLSNMVTSAGGDMVYENAKTLVQNILDKTVYNIALIPHVSQDFNDDTEVLESLYNEFNKNPRLILIPNSLNCMQLKDVVRQCVMVVAARTHCSIAAYSSKIPTLVLGYSVKSRGIALDLFGEYEHYVKSIYDLKKTSEFWEAFCWLDKNKVKIKSFLDKKIPDYIKEIKKLKQYVDALDNKEDVEFDTVPQKAIIGKYKKDTLSIITTCYNSEKYLYRYFDSILGQTNHNIQLVVVNDGSTDSTEKIISYYTPVFKTQGIEVIYLKQPNGGIGSAYNLAMKYVSGEYFCWCDSDNFYASNFVDTILSYVKKHPGTKILRHDGLMINEKDLPNDQWKDKENIKFSQNSPNPYEKKLFMNAILERNWHFGNIVLSTSAFDCVSDREIYASRAGQNWQLCLPMLYAYDANYIPDVLFYFVMRDDSLSRKNLGRQNSHPLYRQMDDYKYILINTIKKIKPKNQQYLLDLIEQKYLTIDAEFAKSYNDQKTLAEVTLALSKSVQDKGNIYENELDKISKKLN